MNKKIIFLLIAASMAYGNDAKVPNATFLIDTIQAVVFGQEGLQIITYSDVSRPGLAGIPRTLDDLIFERIVYLDAQKFKILADEETVDRYLAMVQKENNLTLDQLKEVFASAGYSYEEGREQFKMLQTVNSMIDFKIRSHVIVPRHLVEQYYKEHPVYEEAAYKIQIGFMPYADDTQAQKKALTYMAKTGKEIRSIEWHEPFWVKESEIAQDKEFVFKLKIGYTSLPIDVGNGFEIYRLVNKKETRQIPLEERYKEIANILRQPIYQELMEKYKKQLFDTASILYF